MAREGSRIPEHFFQLSLGGRLALSHVFEQLDVESHGSFLRLALREWRLFEAAIRSVFVASRWQLCIHREDSFRFFGDPFYFFFDSACLGLLLSVARLTCVTSEEDEISCPKKSVNPHRGHNDLGTGSI